MNKVLNAESLIFMKELWSNNHKQWFDANRDRYVNTVREPMKSLAEALAGPMSLYHPDFLEKPKISRINADIRFHKDKPPYKEHVWLKFGGGCPAEMFAAISHKGWEAGCALGSTKKSDLDIWRTNLIKHYDTWSKYLDALDKVKVVSSFTDNPYKKPLYENAPDEVFDFIQARALYIWGKEQTEFKTQPETLFLESLALFLPIYFFMTYPYTELEDRLKELCTEIEAPFPTVEKVWRVFQA